MTAVRALVFLAALQCLYATSEGESLGMTHKANPMRKVINMLRGMSKKVEEEGESELKLFDKFMCHCKTGLADLEKTVSDGETKVPQLESDIKESQSRKMQLEEDLKKHHADRAAANEAMAKATSIRDKQAKDFAAEAAESKSNMASTAKAITAIEKGTGGAFLQTHGASVLQQVIQQRANMDDSDRDVMTSFLTGTTGETAPSSSEITGILKTMHEDMSKDLAEAQASEASAISGYDDLMAAKARENKALKKAIEEKTSRVGELAVQVVQQQGDLSGTEDSLVADKAFLANLGTQCKTKQQEWEEVQKVRGEELVALSDTVKILNDDDALELAKKTMSFVQVTVSAADMRKRALAVIKSVRKATKTHRLDFIALAMHGKTAGFETVIEMVDNMVGVMQKEQKDDEHKKQYCAKQFDEADDKQKDVERSISDMETVVANSNDGIALLQEEIATLSQGIKDLDQSVGEATKQRQAENAEATATATSNAQAKELLGFAKNRLNKFYNPSLHKKAALVQLHSKSTSKNDDFWKPDAEPRAALLSTKRKAESAGVIAMLDALLRDIDKEVNVAAVEEREAQADYEQMTKDSQDKRAGDVKNLAGKQKTLADLRSDLETTNEGKAAASKELGAQKKYIFGLHSECDWLLQNFGVRKEARKSEIEALVKAKAVLNGADYSLVQVKEVRRSLRGNTISLMQTSARQEPMIPYHGDPADAPLPEPEMPTGLYAPFRATAPEYR